MVIHISIAQSVQHNQCNQLVARTEQRNWSVIRTVVRISLLEYGSDSSEMPRVRRSLIRPNRLEQCKNPFRRFRTWQTNCMKELSKNTICSTLLIALHGRGCFAKFLECDLSTMDIEIMQLWEISRKGKSWSNSPLQFCKMLSESFSRESLHYLWPCNASVAKWWDFASRRKELIACQSPDAVALSSQRGLSVVT